MVMQIGDVVPVQLQDELIRGQVTSIEGDEIVVDLNVVDPFNTKIHGYKKGDQARCTKMRGPLIVDGRWQALEKVAGPKYVAGSKVTKWDDVVLLEVLTSSNERHKLVFTKAQWEQLTVA